MVRTACVATMLDGGHAVNALPQRAGANVNCRIFPGEAVGQTAAALTKAIGDPGVKGIAMGTSRPLPIPPPLDPKRVDPPEKLVAQHFPRHPLNPQMSTGPGDDV